MPVINDRAISLTCVNCRFGWPHPARNARRPMGPKPLIPIRIARDTGYSTFRMTVALAGQADVNSTDA